MGRPIALFIRGTLAHELSVLRAAEVALALEVVDVRPGIHLNQLVTGTRHTGGRGVGWSLGRCEPRERQPAEGSYVPSPQIHLQPVLPDFVFRHFISLGAGARGEDCGRNEWESRQSGHSSP